MMSQQHNLKVAVQASGAANKVAPKPRPYAKLLPDWHMRYRARRGPGKSNPAILCSVFAMTIVGILAGCVFLSNVLYKDLQETDRLHAVASNSVAVLNTKTLLDDARAIVDNLTPKFYEYASAHEGGHEDKLRALRREVYKAFDGSAINGLMLIGAHGQAILESGRLTDSSFTGLAATPLEQDADFVEGRIRFFPSADGRTVRLSYIIPKTELRVVVRLDGYLLSDALGSSDSDVWETYLYDEGGRILASSQGEISKIISRLEPIKGAGLVSDGTGTAEIYIQPDQSLKIQTASSELLEQGIFITTTSVPITLQRYFAKYFTTLGASVGIAMAFLGLIVFFLQNEWKKNDRRTSLDEDAVARSEIAADMMNFGIIDWRVSDAAVFYSEGWQKLFAEKKPINGQEIFDWLDRVHPDARASAREEYQALLEGEQFEVNHEIQVRRIDGDYIKVRESGRVRLDAKGRPSRVILVQRPVRGRD